METTMMNTKYGVDKLTEHMINKYGLLLGITLLGKQYGYKFKYKHKSRTLICTDSNTLSSFYGQTYELVVEISDDELEALKMILS